MFRIYLRDLNLIKLLLEIKSSSPVAKLALKVDVNLLNQPCKPAEWYNKPETCQIKRQEI